MRICVMGSGGLGGLFGGWLAASGQDVVFIARGAHLEAMKNNGLTVTSPLGDKHISPVQVTDDPRTIDPVDVVLFCVKNYGLEEAAKQIQPILKDNTAVISVLNGIDASDRIAAILGSEHAVPGFTYVPSNIVRPGVIAHMGELTDITFGEPDGRTSPRLVDFRDVCRAAGFDAKVSGNIISDLWTKFVGWSSVSSVICANCQSFGDMQSDPVLIDLFRAVANEVVQVGRAKGVDLPETTVDGLVERIMSFAPDVKPSMLVDMNQGKQIEVETACGAVARLGAELGIGTPMNQALYIKLSAYNTSVKPA